MTITAQTFVSVVTIAVILHVVLGTVAYLIYIERKMASYIQDRIGPNRVGFDFGLPFLKFLRGKFGLGQPLADGMKFLLKEDYTPDHVDKGLFTLAPIAIIIPAFIGFAIIPWGGIVQIPEFSLLFVHVTGGSAVVAGLNADIGIIYLLGVASLGVYGVTLGGWASNNKYSFLGGLRATAQMISYEIPMGASLLAVLLVAGTILPVELIAYQRDHGWMILAQPIAAVVFFIAMLAEANRTPFDNAEAEQELVGGYHTEYSSMRFALFFLAEYGHMITSSAFFTLVFLGGWEPVPFLSVFGDGTGGILAVLAMFAVFFGKTMTLVVFMMLIRWTLPRLRYDQVMTMAWQAVIPLSLAVVVMTSVMVFLSLDSLVPMVIANAALFALVLAVLPWLPRYEPNRKVPMFGSRFNPVRGQAVVTTPTDAAALADDPIAGAAPAS